MIALALLISCLFSHPRTATVFCYMLVFASGLIGRRVRGQSKAEMD